MSRSNRPGQRPIAGVCPCHGTAPHKFEPKKQADESAKGGRKPRPSAAGRKPRYPVSTGRGPAKGGRR